MERISVERRLPEMRKDGMADCYLVSDGYFAHMAYFVSGEWVYCELGQMTDPMETKVLYWAEIPQPPLWPDVSGRKKVGKDIPFERIRRITGYLVGTMDKWNDAKKAEERDRVKHL